MQIRARQTDSKTSFLAAVGTVIYAGLIIRSFVHFLSRAPWPGFTVSFNKTMLIFSVIFWGAGIIALWMQKTVTTRLVGVMAVFATLMHGLILRMGASTMSPEGFVYVAFAAVLCFVTLDELHRRVAVDGSYLPTQPEPRSAEEIKDDEEPEPPIDEHRLVG